MNENLTKIMARQHWSIGGVALSGIGIIVCGAVFFLLHGNMGGHLIFYASPKKLL